MSAEESVSLRVLFDHLRARVGRDGEGFLDRGFRGPGAIGPPLAGSGEPNQGAGPEDRRVVELV